VERSSAGRLSTVRPVEESRRADPARAGTPETRGRLLVLPTWSAYVLAVVLPVSVTLVVRGLDNPAYRVGSAFLAAVLIVAALGGTGAAIVAAVTSTLGFWYASLTPSGSFDLAVPEGLVSLLVFLVSTGVIVVITAQRDRAFRRTAEHERRYRRLSDIGLIGVMFWNLDGRITDANDAFLAMLGYSRDDLEEGRLDWKELTPEEFANSDAEKVRELVVHGFHEPYEKEYVRKDGSRISIVLGTAFLEGSDREGISYVVDISERARFEAEREALLSSEQAARHQAEVANHRLELISSAADAMMDELEPEAVIHRLAEVLVPELAEVVSVFVPEGDLLRRALTVHHTHPEVARAMTGRHPVSSRSDSPVAKAFRAGRTVHIPAGKGRWPARMEGTDPALIDIVKHFTDGVAIPLRTGTDVLGVVALSGTSDRPLEHNIARVAEPIAERAAAALQKAQTFAAERRVATLMQRALLPDSERRIEGHDVGTCYVPAAVGREIGGDWWDIVPLPDGRVAIVVGDISGHGVHLAPSMAKMRHSISGVLTHGASPAEAATAASRLLKVSRPGAYATAFVAVYDPRTRELVYSRAGHPPALVLLESDVLELDHPGGTLLGLEVAERQQTTVQLPERFELIAFTDGLIEAPGLTYDEGVEQLIDAARALPGDLVGQERAESLVASVVGTEGTDDVCVIMVRPCPDDSAGA